MFSGVMDKAKDLVSSGVDAAKDGVGALKEGVAAAADGLQDAVANLDPKKRLLKELKEKVDKEAGPMTELLDQLKGLTASLEGMSCIESIGTTLQGDIVGKFTEVAKGKKDAMGIPPCAMCAASMWVSSIREKMSGIAKDVDTKVISKVTGLGGTLEKPTGGILENLAEFKSKIQGAMDSLDSLVKLPESLKDIDFSLGGLDDFEGKLNKAVETCQAALNGAWTALTETIKELGDNCSGFVEGFDRFMTNAPAQVVKAFRPPMPFCCFSVAQDKIDNITSALDAGKSMLDAPLTTLKETVAKLQEMSSNISINPKMIDPFADQLKDALAKIKEMAGKLPGSDLRQCGSAEEEAPAACDAEPEA